MIKKLSDYFQKIAYKRLSAVEADSSVSNQHEFNGISALKDIFGTEKLKINAAQIYLDDVSEEPLFEKTELTWYDARENHQTRTEHRLYYKSSDITRKFHQGDLMIIAQGSNGLILNIIAENGSSAEKQLEMLFGISGATSKIKVQNVAGDKNAEIDFIRSFILEKLGIADESPEGIPPEQYLEEMLRLFPGGLPSTREFSEFARRTTGISANDTDADTAIMKWWERETLLFKLYEKHQFDSRKDKNQDDIDSFIKLSLSLQNTRKSRAGSALENHLEQILIDRYIPYSRTPVTENNSKPDFIFPGMEAYHDATVPESDLHMLGVKTSCKDRWRQVLTEAKRISHKHLLTLEPGISQNQTDEMKASNLTLVLPKEIHRSYNKNQQAELLTVTEFLKIVGIASNL